MNQPGFNGKYPTCLSEVCVRVCSEGGVLIRKAVGWSCHMSRSKSYHGVPQNCWPLVLRLSVACGVTSRCSRATGGVDVCGCE